MAGFVGQAGAFVVDENTVDSPISTNPYKSTSSFSALQINLKVTS